MNYKNRDFQIKDNEIAKKMFKTSSWESLQTMKKLSNSLVKSNSQMLHPIKNMATKNASISQFETMKKNSSMSDLTKSILNFNLAISVPYLKNDTIDNNNDLSHNYVKDREDDKIKIENLSKLLDNKNLELIEFRKNNREKDMKIFQLEQNLQILLRYNSKLENINLKQVKTERMNEFFLSYDIQLMMKNKEIVDLKSENLKLKNKASLSEEEIFKKHMFKIQTERIDYEIKIKQILVEKEMKIDELGKALFIATEQIKDYKLNYIDKIKHEFIVKKQENVINEMTKKIVIDKEENTFFNTQSHILEKLNQEKKPLRLLELLIEKTINFELISNFITTECELDENEDSIYDEVLNIPSIKLIEPCYNHRFLK